MTFAWGGLLKLGLSSKSSTRPCPRFSPRCLEVPLRETNAIVVLNTSCEIDILNKRGKKRENTNVSDVVPMNTVRSGDESTFIAWTGNGERSVKMIKRALLVVRRCRKLAWNIP